jgi:hypothetical protein
VVDADQVQRLEADLLEDLKDDWVSILAMVWSAEHVLGLEDQEEIRKVIIAALANLVENPKVQIVDGDMIRSFDDRDELARHIRDSWPVDGRTPVSGEVAWLVERDFELRQPRDDS